MKDSGPVVLITGCSSGIGKESALAFARAGYRVVATVRSLHRSAGLREAARAERIELRIEELDVTRPAGFGAFVDELLAREGRLDVLVNNAGVLPVGAFEDLGESGLRETMETNFFGPALLTQAVLPAMRRQRSGYIIMISSLSGIAATATDSVYAASKFALEGLTEGLRWEVARWNIRTALVQPGHHATQMFRATTEAGPDARSADSPYRALVDARQAAVRAGLAEGRDPRALARLIVAIAGSDGQRLRWTGDEEAERVVAALASQDDAARQAFLRDVADVDWWIRGDDAPGGDS